MKKGFRKLFTIVALMMPSLALADWKTDAMPYAQEFVTVLFNTLGNQIVLIVVGLIMVGSALQARQMGNWTPLIYGGIASALIVLGTSLNVMTEFTDTLKNLF